MNNYKFQKQLQKKNLFDKGFIDNFYRKQAQIQTHSFRSQTIIDIYEKYLNRNIESYIKHSCYKFMQYIILISEKQFQEEFNVQNDNDIKQIVNFLGDFNCAHDHKEMELLAKISHHMERTRIYIWFTDEFKMEDIPDNVILNLFNNIENRLQMVSASHSFIIVRRQSDNTIFKMRITGRDDNKINASLQQFMNNKELYDVILQTQRFYPKFGNIRIRYLNYQSNYILELQHPTDVISCSLQISTVKNLNKFVNLKNLFTISNKYTKNYFKEISTLIRISSWKDQYFSDKSLVEDILNNNHQLQYINIQDGYDKVHLLLQGDKYQQLRFIDVPNTQLNELQKEEYQNDLNDIQVQSDVKDKDKKISNQHAGQQFKQIDMIERQRYSNLNYFILLAQKPPQNDIKKIKNQIQQILQIQSNNNTKDQEKSQREHNNRIPL